MTLAQDITRHFGGEWHGTYGAFPAPGHSPSDRGVTVKDADGGRDVLFNSFNGADWRDIKDECRRLGILPEREPDNDRGNQPRETGHYEYADAEGAVLYRTVRIEQAGKRKRFAAQRPDGRGGWTGGIGGIQRVLYRLPELAAADPAQPVYFVEGERKADKLASWGFVATAIAFGAKGWQRDYAAALSGRTVIFLPDNDDAGREFAANARADLEKSGCTVHVIDLPGLPEKGDIMDWTGSAEDLRALVDQHLNPPVQLLPIIDISGWIGKTPPAREWIVQDWIPSRQTTMLTGAGGVGKSLLAQQLATCVALGLPFMGQAIQQTGALYLSCEDDAEELWRRQAAICAGLGVGLESVVGKLHLVSLMGETDVSLASFDPSGRIVVSQRWRDLNSTADMLGIGFAALDNATDLMAGDLNDIHPVAEFINLLTGLALRRDGAVLILHHPNKGGDDWLGSVAWHNKVRSRLILKRDEVDSDARLLENPKANYAPSGCELSFRWIKGAFLTLDDLPDDRRREFIESARAGADNAIFLSCLAERTRQQRAVSERRGPTFAPTEFAKMPESKGIGKARLEAAMDRLFRIDKIERAELWKGSDRKPVFGLRETAGNGAGNGAVNTVQELRDTGGKPAEKRAGNAGNTHSISKDIGHGPLEAAVPSPEMADSDPASRTSFADDDGLDEKGDIIGWNE